MLAPVAVGVLAFIVHGGVASSSAPAPVGPGQPAVLVPRLLARLLPVADIAAREQLVAALLVALAAALVVYVVAAARGDRAAALGGVVAGLWLAASPPTWALAARLGPEVVGLAACALLLAAHDRLARGGGPPSAGLIGVAAALAVLADRRVALLALVIAVLVGYRGRRGARWVALAPALAVVVALVLIAAAALTGGPHAPSWPPGRGLDPWLAALVDELGPVALVTGGLGIALAVGGRGDRWLGAALIAGLIAALPPAWPVAPVALVALALGIGHAVAAAARAAERVAALTGASSLQTATTVAVAPSRPGPAIGPWAVALVLAALVLIPPAYASTARGRDRARVSSYAAAPWKSSPVTRR